jgi:type I restriction enzyme S subunit
MDKGYKQTEVGVIPGDWEVRVLSEITKKIQTGPFGSQLHSYDYVLEGTPIINPSNLLEGKIIPDDNNGISNSKVRELSRYTLFEGDIVVGRRGEMGRAGYVTSNENGWICGTGSLLIRLDKNLSNPLYLNEVLKTNRIKCWLSLNSVGTTMENINAKIVGLLPLPLPPTIAEQTAIATALSDADQYITHLEQLIAKKRLIKQGAMQELLKPKEGWVVKKLGDIAEITMGQSPLSEFYNTEGYGLPLIQGNADVDNRKTIIRSYTSSITKRGKVGDIIMSVRAPVGEISKATFDCCLGRGVCSIRFQNEYMYHYLIFFERSWAKFSTGSTFDSVNSTQVKQLDIPIPEKDDEQTRIATILSEMDAEIATLETKLTKAQSIKQGMMQQLLTGKIRLI